MHLQSRQRLAHRHHFQPVDVEVRRQVRDPPGLFGDTDAVEVHLDGDGYAMSQQRRGDTNDVMLDYVGYRLDALRATYRDKVAAGNAAEAERMNAELEAGLTAYTYLSDEPLG